MFYLIRHGEADYSNNGNKIYRGVGVNFAPLTMEGIDQIKTTAADARLKDADIIISSPYTRALQSAAILSKELQIDLIVEPGLFEWSSDVNFTDLPPEESKSRIDEFNEYNGDYPGGERRPWEDNESLSSRLYDTLAKYDGYKKVIVVCHGMLIHSVDKKSWLENGEIFELSMDDCRGGKAWE
jgi:broad specificity phosphatase PhoE